MGLYFLAIFVAMPIIEIAVFIQAGEWIGLWPTIAIVILTAMIGTSLMRKQGLQTLARAQQQMDQGEMPIGPLFDGICILIAGVLLLTPGFVTDTMGFLLLIPPLRKMVGAGVIMKLVQSGNLRSSFSMRGGPAGRGGNTRPHGAHGPQGTNTHGRGNGGSASGRGPIIDGDFEDVSSNRTPEGNGADNPGHSQDNSQGNIQTGPTHLPPRHDQSDPRN